MDSLLSAKRLFLHSRAQLEGNAHEPEETDLESRSTLILNFSASKRTRNTLLLFMTMEFTGILLNTSKRTTAMFASNI